MNWRFRRQVKLAPGLWLNLNKGMPSVSVGEGPFTVNVSKRGVRGTAGLHGTGLSVSHPIPWPNGCHGGDYHSQPAGSGSRTTPAGPVGTFCILLVVGVLVCAAGMWPIGAILIGLGLVALFAPRLDPYTGFG